MYDVIKSIDRCYEDLANAIVEQAAHDYRRIIRRRRYDGAYAPKNEKKKIIKFFKSDWCNFLTKVSGVGILNRLDKEFEQEQKKKKGANNE